MINSNRIVPVTKTDLLTLYRMIIQASNNDLINLYSETVNGDFFVPENKTYLCTEPVKSIDFSELVTTATVYFIAGYNFEGFYVDGVKTEPVDGVVSDDDGTLYGAELASGKISVFEY